MSFTLHPATYTDIEPLIDLYLKAFENDELYPYMYPDLPREEVVRFESSGPRALFYRYPWVRLWKVVEEESGKTVAWARWHSPRVLTEEEKKQPGDYDHFDPIPEGANVKLCEEWFEKLEAAEYKYIDRENGYFINYLVVDPEYGRRGLGGMLMKIGLDAADREGRRVVLVATAKGVGLYRKLGFEEIDRISADLTPHGGEGMVTWVVMRREPVKREENKDGEEVSN